MDGSEARGVADTAGAEIGVGGVLEVGEVDGDGVGDAVVTVGSGEGGAGVDADSATAEEHPAATAATITMARASLVRRAASTGSSCAMPVASAHQTRRRTLTTLPMMLASSPRMGA